MAKGFNRPPGGGKQQGMMAQLQRMQQQLAEAQEALARDPASDFLADHYTAMMKKKLRLLRGAARQVEVSS